jgi:aquaporin Z
MRDAIRSHWREYAIEAGALGSFMVSACVFTALFEYPPSPVRQAIANADVRRVLTGIAMGLTAIAIIYSPWGERSGAHINPATTLTFYRLGKVAPWDATFYALAQFIGAIVGVLLSALLLGRALTDPAVNYVITMPGPRGVLIAFAAEFAITALLIIVVLVTASSARLGRYTGLFVGAMVATYISVEAPFSGMSMNPARSFAPALVAGNWTALWIYFTAPPLGMLLGAELFLRSRRARAVPCAKMHHRNGARCIFCEYRKQVERGVRAPDDAYSSPDARERAGTISDGASL